MATATAYEDALEFLFPRVTTIKFGLDTTRTLLAAVGNPHEMIPSIHVGGTNGKGSVASLIASALGEMGWKVGLYTSPHVVSFRERMRVAGVPISEEAVAMWTAKLRPLIEEHGGTFFEATTAMAFADFAARGVEIAVVEVGLGGTARQHQCRAAAGERGDQDRDGPREVPRRHAGAHRRREGGDRQAGSALRDRRVAAGDRVGAVPRGPALRGRPRARRDPGCPSGAAGCAVERHAPARGSAPAAERRGGARGTGGAARHLAPGRGRGGARVRRGLHCRVASTAGAASCSTWRTTRMACARW